MTDNVETHASETDPPIPCRKKSIWTDGLTAFVANLFNNGYSANAIARELLRDHGLVVTRNSVIGKLNRLGLRRDPDTVVPVVVNIRRQRPAKPSSFVPRVVKSLPRRITFAALGDKQCRYECGGGDAVADFLFCGLPVSHYPSGEPMSWCAQHASLIFVPPKIRSRVKEAA